MISKPMPIDPSEREYLKSENEQLKADLAQARKEIERLKEAVAENKSDEEDAKINYQRWRNCEAERDTLQARVEQLPKQVLEVMGAFSDEPLTLEQMLDFLRKKRAERDAWEDQACARVKSLQDTNSLLNERIAALKQQVAALSNEMSAAEFKEYAHRDDWGVDCVYLSTLNQILADRASRSTAGLSEEQP